MKSILCFVLLFVASFVGAQSKDEIEQYIAKQLAAQKITGLTIGIIENGKITLAKGYGVANLEQHIPASEKTVYKIGSLSKQMVATGIMLLVQSGKLALSDAVINYYPDAPAAWSGITIRHLLNHTSGLIRESPVFDATEVKHDTVLIKAAYKVPLVFATGTKWQYCNLGYFMLADIIRKLSGKSFQQFMTEEVFSKHRLIHTQPTSTKTLIPNRAGGYVFAGKDSILENASDYIAFRPSGAFVSTITDMLQWELLIQNGKLLSTQSWQQMWTDTVSTDPANAKADFYGYGWRVDQFKGRTMVSHGGALPGFRSAYFRFPADKTAVIILTNSDHANGMLIAKGVVDLLYKSK